MRAVLVALLATTTGVACKIDLDEFEEVRLCEEGSAAVCREAVNHSEFEWLQDNLFSTNCSGDDCHGVPVNGQPPGGKLVLAKGFAYATLLGKAADAPGEPPLVASQYTDDHKLVQPGAPNRSYLLYMMRGVTQEQGVPRFTAPPDDPGFMPPNSKPLCCQKLDAVSRWIEAGALP